MRRALPATLAALLLAAAALAAQAAVIQFGNSLAGIGNPTCLTTIASTDGALTFTGSGTFGWGQTDTVEGLGVCGGNCQRIETGESIRITLNVRRR